MVWMRRFLYLLLAALTLAVCLVLTMPMRFAVDYFGAPPALGLEHVRGNLVEGRAGLVFNPPPGLPARADVAWHWCPGFPNPLAWCVNADASPLRVETVAMWSPPRAVVLSGGMIEAKLDRQPLPFGRVTLPLSAHLRIMIDTARFAPGGFLPQALQGRAAIEDLSTDLFNAGNFDADIASDENGGFAASVRGGGEMFKITGEAALAADRSYRYQLDFETDQDLVRDYLSSRGKANDKGGYRLSGAGKF